MTNSKYKMFLNYMHNELEITKEDIRGWVHDAVMEVAERYIRQTFEQQEDRLRTAMYDQARSYVKSQKENILRVAGAYVADMLTVDVKEEFKQNAKEEE